MSDCRVLKSGMTLAVIAAICTALVALTYRLTAERIVANEQAWLERSLQPALSGLFFDSGVTESKIIVPPPHELPGSEAAIIYRVYAEGEPVAALFVVSARDGYAGPIRMLVGIDMRRRRDRRCTCSNIAKRPGSATASNRQSPTGSNSLTVARWSTPSRPAGRSKATAGSSIS